jgi:hypothetical protein
LPDTDSSITFHIQIAFADITNRTHRLQIFKNCFTTPWPRNYVANVERNTVMCRWRKSTIDTFEIVPSHNKKTQSPINRPRRQTFFQDRSDEEKQRSFTFLTNQYEFAAATVAAIYRDRWAVELLFKAIKQNLKIKTFLGTNANAVKTQIWTALIAMLVLRYLQLMSSFGWSLSNLAALLRHQLFVYRDLFGWLNAPFEGPPQLAEAAKAQLSLGITAWLDSRI